MRCVCAAVQILSDFQWSWVVGTPSLIRRQYADISAAEKNRLGDADRRRDYVLSWDGLIKGP